jgi:hypothetical protein
VSCVHPTARLVSRSTAADRTSSDGRGPSRRAQAQLIAARQAEAQVRPVAFLDSPPAKRANDSLSSSLSCHRSSSSATCPRSASTAAPTLGGPSGTSIRGLGKQVGLEAAGSTKPRSTDQGVFHTERASTAEAESSGSALREDTQLVSLRIGQDQPRDLAALPNVCGGRAHPK